MLRAVLDTNVYVAALLSERGAPAEILLALRDGVFDVVVSPTLIGELRGVLIRDKLARYVTRADAEAFVSWIERVAVMSPDGPLTEGASPDPADDYLIALARSCDAHFLVSGDAHLLGLGTAVPPILAPRPFARLLAGLR